MFLELARSLVRHLCDHPGLNQLGHKGARGQVSEGRVWPIFVVFDPPGLDVLPGIGPGREPRGIETLLPEPTVKGLNQRMVRGFSGLQEVEFNLAQIRSLVEEAADVLGIEKAGAANSAIANSSVPSVRDPLGNAISEVHEDPIELALTAVLVAALYYLKTNGTFRISGLSRWSLVCLCAPLLRGIAHVMIKEEIGNTPIIPIQVTFFRFIISTAFLVIVLLLLSSDLILNAPFAVLKLLSILVYFIYFLELIIYIYAVLDIEVPFAGSITTPWPALIMGAFYPHSR